MAIQSVLASRNGCTVTKTDGSVSYFGWLTVTAIVAFDTALSIGLGVLIGLAF